MSAEILLLKVGACLGELAFSLLPSSSSFGEPNITFLSARNAKTGAGVSGASSIVNSAIALTFARTDNTRTELHIQSRSASKDVVLTF